MVSPLILDFAVLLAPIPGAQPSGKHLLHDPVYDALREARRADASENWGEWQRELKTADWSAVIELACKALTTQSKDLQIATLIEEVLQGTVRVSKDLEATISARIADIDALLSRQLNALMHAPEFQKAFRESEDSRYVGLTLPHILMRLPYGAETAPVEAFNFTEDVDGRDHSKYLWGNAAYAFGTRLSEAFATHHWCAAIRGVEGGGLVEGLPAHTFKTDDGEVALKCPTEIAITDRREKELLDLGLIPLVYCKGTDYAAFFGAQSCQKARRYDLDAANTNVRLSTQLQYIMATSRFAHYLTAMMRDKIGSFMTRQNCEDYLNRWIANYVLLDDSASQEAKAENPLCEARIDVVEVPGKPGVYRAVAFLKPHFQLDELTLSLRLVAELPPPAQG